VIAVTANAMIRDVERGKAAGFVDYIAKPLDMVLFFAVIDRQLAHAKGEE
jgi:CheY-like chemotaxis protein